MAGINKVIIVGNLGDDPSCNLTSTGNTVTNISVATSQKWTDKKTQQQIDKGEWHRVCIFGNSADYASKYARKGSKVYVEGKLQTRKWQDKTTGADRWTTEVIVSGYTGIFELLDKRENNNNTENEQTFPYGKMPEELEDIPF